MLLVKRAKLKYFVSGVWLACHGEGQFSFVLVLFFQNKRTISLKFERKTTGQASCKTWQLPEGRRQRAKRQKAMTFKLGTQKASRFSKHVWQAAVRLRWGSKLQSISEKAKEHQGKHTRFGQSWREKARLLKKKKTYASLSTQESGSTLCKAACSCSPLRHFKDRNLYS